MSDDGDRKRSRLAIALRITAIAPIAFMFYLFYRQVNRSLYASNAEYLNPKSWLDTSWAQFGGMFVFALLMMGALWLDVRPQKPLIPEKAADDAAVRRRRDSKRFNERLKLASSGLNAIGTAALVAGFVGPYLGGIDVGGQNLYKGVGVAVVCYLAAQLVIGLWKTEE